MNNTKWNELKDSMYSLGDLSPKWRTKCVTNGYISTWDGDWYYHFSDGGYVDIEWAELSITSDEQRNAVLNALKRIHLPGEQTEFGYKNFGYFQKNQSVNYI